MDIGSGIAAGSGISSIVLGTVAVIFKAINSRKGCAEKGGGVPKLCSEHSGLVAGILSIKESQDRHEKWLYEIAQDVKLLLLRRYKSRREDLENDFG